MSLSEDGDAPSSFPGASFSAGSSNSSVSDSWSSILISVSPLVLIIVGLARESVEGKGRDGGDQETKDDEKLHVLCLGWGGLDEVALLYDMQGKHTENRKDTGLS